MPAVNSAREEVQVTNEYVVSEQRRTQKRKLEVNEYVSLASELMKNRRREWWNDKTNTQIIGSPVIISGEEGVQEYVSELTHFPCQLYIEGPSSCEVQTVQQPMICSRSTYHVSGIHGQNVDSRIGQYAAVISGQMKGWQGRLIRLTDKNATIECAGRQMPEITEPLKNFVLM